MRTGILGGSFDPIHIAHLHAGETSLAEAELDRVLFMPAGDPWQKPRDLTPGPMRVEMVSLAIAGVDGFEPDDREVRREGLTYTIDTLRTFPDDEELSLILGADAAAGLRTWKEWEQVVDRAEVLVVPRPGTDPGLVTEAWPQARMLDMAALDVSGTLIRRKAAAGQPFRFLVPPAVYEYISANHLYAQPAADDMVGVSYEQEDAP